MRPFRLWSSDDDMAGLRFIAPGFEGGDPVFTSDKDQSCQTIIWPSANGKGKFVISMTEDGLKISSKGIGDWCLEMSAAPGLNLPFVAITSSEVIASAQDREYLMSIGKGSAEDLRKENPGKVLRLVPSHDQLEVSFQVKEVPSLGK